MASISQVLADVTALSAEAKRRAPEVRSAAEAALQQAKNVPLATPLSSSTDLQRTLCSPFLLALESANAKLIACALPPVLRLASSKSLAPDHPRKIVHSLYKLDSTAQPVESQLKILQLLPPLMSTSSSEAPDFSHIVAVASCLANSANVVVANTASATLQQIFASLFDCLKAHHALPEARQHSVQVTLTAEETLRFVLDDLELECFRVFSDLSAVLSGESLSYFTDKSIHIPREQTLEILETILSLNKETFQEHPELFAVLKSKTMPGLLKLLNSPSSTYPLIVRTLRVILLLTSYPLTHLSEETELFLASVNHIILDSASSALGDTNSMSSTSSHTFPYWGKLVVLEMYKSMITNFDSVHQLYGMYSGKVGSKNVLLEIFSVMNNVLENDFPTLLGHDVIVIPQDHSPSCFLSKQNSSCKIALMDHLDKSEPLHTPELYAPLLILTTLHAFADGVSLFVSNLSVDATSDSLEADVNYITSLNQAVFSEIYSLFSKFLYFPMDSEYFHITIRALQKYTHAIGLLGLSSLRDSLFLLLSNCIIKNSVLEEHKKGSASNLISLGESIVESLSSTIQQSTGSVSSPNRRSQSSDQSSSVATVTSKVQNESRNFNSRQVTCLRAFSNLVISLGSTLQSSWTIIWTTLQWVDYFINGPDERKTHYGQKEAKRYTEPKLSPQDLAGIESSHMKLLESFSEYQEDSFIEMFVVLIDLFELEYKDTSTTDLPVEMCPFNKSYYLKSMITLSEIHTKNFSFVESKTWTLVTNFFYRQVTNRSFPHQTRIYLVDCFTKIIVSVTRRGFKLREDTDIYAKKSLDAMIALLNQLLDLGRPQENLVLNCETEMHLSILSTLHGLIDEYDKYYQNSWDLVFKILNTAFENSDEKSDQNSKLAEKIVMLITTSFDTLKLILDEFLSTLPFIQLKSLIDTLLNFCSQTYDLNISFSSVSYFWLISDCINGEINIGGIAVHDSLQSVRSIEDLEVILEESSSDTGHHYGALNIYLLAKLSHLSTDKRDQVREGAIQTLFQILEVQGKQTQSWDLIFTIVFPELLSGMTKLDSKANTAKQKDMMTSLNLVLSGLVSIYSKFLMNFKDKAVVVEKYWAELLEFMNSLLLLRWTDLNLQIFQSYQDLLLALCGLDYVPQQITEMFFSFWTSVSIEYDFIKPEYQESLAVYNESFKSLFKLIKDGLTIADTNKVLSRLNKCARYPVLKPGFNDAVKPSSLQKSVIDNLVLLDEGTENEEVIALVILQLAQVSAYPSEIRSRIEAKLKSKFEGKLKIPTFVALSELAFRWIWPKVEKLKSLHVLLQDNRFHRMMLHLLDSVRNKTHGITTDGESPFWVRCNEVILRLITRLVDENLSEFEHDKQVWQIILECVTVNFEVEGSEEPLVKQYYALADKVLPVFFERANEELLADFVSRVYEQSFLYEKNAVEETLMSGESKYHALTEYRFEDTFGTTADVEILSNREVRMNCLMELFHFASGSGYGSEVAKEYILVRAAFAVRRFIADSRLSRFKPIPQIQEEELLAILEGLSVVGSGMDKGMLHGISRLLTQCLSYADRVSGMDKAMLRVLQLGLAGTK